MQAIDALTLRVNSKDLIANLICSMPQSKLDVAPHLVSILCRQTRRISDPNACVSERCSILYWETAVRFGLGPVLAQHWRIDGQVVPPKLSAVVAQYELDVRRRADLLAIYSRAILTGLCKIGVSALIYKGLPLSAHLYGEEIVRSSGDIDVLVRRQDLCAVAAHLEGLGLTCVVALDWLNRRLLTQNFFEVEWRDPLVGVEVDIHWHLAPRWIPHVDITAQLLADGAAIKIGGQPWPWCSAGKIWYIQLIELIKADWLEPKSLVSFAHAWDIVLRDSDEHAAGLLLRTLPAPLADCAVLLLNNSLHRRVPDEWIESAQQNGLAGVAARRIHAVYFAPQPNNQFASASALLRAVRYLSCGWALPKTIFSRIFTPHYLDLAAVQPNANRAQLAMAKIRRLSPGRKRRGMLNDR